eukprot:scaffold163657_cov47-Prasinocladus_malaysianus.AAC.1
MNVEYANNPSFVETPVGAGGWGRPPGPYGSCFIYTVRSLSYQTIYGLNSEEVALLFPYCI